MVDCISDLDAERLGIQVLSPNGYLITVLDNIVPEEEITDGKKTSRAWGLLRKPENIELLEDLYGIWLERFVRDGVLKVMLP